jgi:hypothetical protein
MCLMPLVLLMLNIWKKWRSKIENKKHKVEKKCKNTKLNSPNSCIFFLSEKCFKNNCLNTLSSFGKSVSVFVFENCFREQKQKTVFNCFLVKKMFGKLFFKIVFENRKQYLRRLDNCFQNNFHLRKKKNCLAFQHFFSFNFWFFLGGFIFCHFFLKKKKKNCGNQSDNSNLNKSNHTFTTFSLIYMVYTCDETQPNLRFLAMKNTTGKKDQSNKVLVHNLNILSLSFSSIEKMVRH